MALKNIRSSTVSILLAALFTLAVGAYTDNGGFQLAGGILLLVGLIVAFNEAHGQKDNDS